MLNLLYFVVFIAGAVQIFKEYHYILDYKRDERMMHHYENMEKKIWKVLLTMSIIVLFNSVPVMASGLVPETEVTTEITTEVAPEVTTETTTVATPGDAWYTTLPGSPDTTPKTLDDIYEVLYLILVVIVVSIASVAFVFIFNHVM